MKKKNEIDVYFQKSRIVLITAIIAVAAFAILLLAINAQGATITVPDDYPTIQQAIDNASNGDTVLVRNGVYYENAVINKTINLIGEDRINTIIDGGGSGDVIYIDADGVNITDFTLRNGHYGTKLFSNESCISNCNIYSNSRNGTQLYSSSDNTIFNCDIYSNTYTGIGLGEYSSNNVISNCNITDNGDFGIYIWTSSDNNTISKCSVFSNMYNGIVILNSNNNDISSNTITHNWYVGILLRSSHYNNIIGNTIINNTYGIKMWFSNENVIGYNTLNYCFNTTWLWSSHNNTITENNIADGELGIALLSSCQNNYIYHNNLINIHFDPAYDDGTNFWDNGYPSGGNYWSDFDEPSEGAWDTDNDEIADSPYLIPGGSNQDRYPLMHPYGSIVNLNSNEVFGTIQDAIDNANDGDTIKVNPGIYLPIIIDKEINLVGDPYIDGHGGIGISIEANNTLVENFIVYNCSYGICVHNASFTLQNITINNCTVYNCTNDGIVFYEVIDSWINNSQCYNNDAGGIYLYSSDNNDITGNDASNNSYGVYMNFSSGNLISGNILNSNSWAIGLGSSSDNNQISDNTVSNNHLSIYLHYSNGNNITSNSASYNNYSIYIYYSSGNNITNNDMFNNSYGIKAKLMNMTVLSFNEIHYNNIYGNIFCGVCSEGTVHAEYNWWGNASGPGGFGPGTGDNVSNYVNSDPWLGAYVEEEHTEDIAPGSHLINATDEADTTLYVNVSSATNITVISYGNVNPADDRLPGGIKGVGTYIDVIIENESAIIFPVNITIYYTQDDLDAVGITEGQINGMYYWNETMNDWQPYTIWGVNFTDEVIGDTAYKGHVWAWAENADQLSPKVIGANIYTARFYKLDALDELNEIYPTGNKKIDKKLEKAIKHITKSLDNDLWIDDNHLDPKHGHKAFDEEKKAVKKLMKIIKNKDTPDDVKDVCSKVIYKLLTADSILAQIIYEEAQENAGGPHVDYRLKMADKERERAERKICKGRYDKAIDHYKKAWKHAQKALK